MDSALEEVEFLARSSNRVAVLEALAERPQSRAELADRTGASQPTLGRILRDFEERTWAARAPEGYEVTATGRLVADGITDLAEIVETELRLRDVVEWLPTEDLDVDLRAFREATITAPTQTRPSAPVDRVAALLEGVTHARIVSYALNERSLETLHDAVVDGDGTLECVLSASAIDDLAADPTFRRRLRSIAEADRGEIRVHDGPIPLAIGVGDGTLHLLVRDDDGVLQAVLDVDDPRALEWGRTVHERYWADAEALPVESLEG